MAGNERCGSKGKALAKPNTARVNNHALIQTRLSKAGQVNFNYHTGLFFFFSWHKPKRFTSDPQEPLGRQEAAALIL